MTSGGSVITIAQDHDISQPPQLDSPQLTHQKSGLWGFESNPSRQPSIGARASSPSQRRQSQSSGILRTGSGASSKYRDEPHVDSRVEPRASAGLGHKSPVRAPSRLRESTTEEAEVHCAPPPPDGRQSFRESSAEEEEGDLRQKPYKQKHRVSVSGTSVAKEEEDEQQSQRQRPSPNRVLQTSRQKPKGTTTQPHQYYHSAEEYFSRARVREALSPGKGPSHTPQYPAKARILDLHDECTLADEQEDGHLGRADPRDSGQGCAQVHDSPESSNMCGIVGSSVLGEWSIKSSAESMVLSAAQ